jgi:hypothetical protein
VPHIYPPAPPTLSGDILTISRFLNAPALVQRRLRTIAEARFLADSILTGRYETSGGALLYEQTESIYTARPPEAVNAGAEYPRSPAAPGPAALAGVTKWGQDVPVTDEHIHRYGRRAVDVALLKITNYLVKQVDTVAMTLLGLAIPPANQIDVTGDWNDPDPTAKDILLDLLTGKALIESYDQGYQADTVITTDMGKALLTADKAIIAGLAREAGGGVGTSTVTSTGEIQTIAGLRIFATNNIPELGAAGTFVCDSSLLGGLAYERLESPEYSGDPANGVESWTRRDPAANDQWLIRGRRPVVPIIQEPLAAVALIGNTGQPGYVPPLPRVTGVNPAGGAVAGGTPVTITGSRFTGASAVLFGATAAPGFTVNGPTQITVNAPAHAAGAVTISVTTPEGTGVSAAPLFTYA